MLPCWRCSLSQSPVVPVALRTCDRGTIYLGNSHRISALTLILQPYRGFANRSEFFLMGQVFRQPAFGHGLRAGSLGRRLCELACRALRRGLGRREVVVEIGGRSFRTRTDRLGYFRLHETLPELAACEGGWQPVGLRLSDGSCAAEGEVFVPSREMRRIVISDIDDTIMFTGVFNKAMMMWRLFMQGAESRVAFPGVAALYRALYRGPGGNEGNALIYVSRAPWSLYGTLESFFRLHDIPVGPILFLREWGLSLQHPLPRRAKEHKAGLIRHILEVYDDLPFVLIGDSGQADPEIYADLVEEHPGRVEAVYIRHVHRAPERDRAIETLSQKVAEAGSTLLLAADSLAMAREAARHGFIASHDIALVMGERAKQEESPEVQATQQVGSIDADTAADAAGEENLVVEGEARDRSGPDRGRGKNDVC